MADCSVLLGGYKVGLISAALCSKANKKEEKNKRKNTDSLLFTENTSQPTFVAVKKKKLKVVKQEKAETHDDKHNVNSIEKKRKHTDIEESETTTKKARKTPLHKSAQDDPERLARTIFVGNLSCETTRKELKNLFRRFGEIETTRLRSVAVPDFKTSKKLACIKKNFNQNRDSLNGYVVFKSKESIDEALKSNGDVVRGFQIRVDKVDSQGKQYDHKRSVFIGNLAFDIKEQAVRDLFAICGDVENVRIIRDAATGIGKGFGYVLFKDMSSVSLAMKMNNSELSGRNIRIQPSQENPKTTTDKGKSGHKFSGMQAKEKFYHKRKSLKQQKNGGSAKKETKKKQFKQKRTKKPTIKRKK